MFVSGAGNFNTGTPGQMTEAFDKILGLPVDTNVWVGHEYKSRIAPLLAFTNPTMKSCKNVLSGQRSRGACILVRREQYPALLEWRKLAIQSARIDQMSVMELCGPCDDRSDQMRLVRKGKDDWGRRA